MTVSCSKNSRARKPTVAGTYNSPYPARPIAVLWRKGAQQAAFPAPLRYWEDIDLVRTSGGPILDRLRFWSHGSARLGSTRAPPR